VVDEKALSPRAAVGLIAMVAAILAFTAPFVLPILQRLAGPLICASGTSSVMTSLTVHVSVGSTRTYNRMFCVAANGTAVSKDGQLIATVLLFALLASAGVGLYLWRRKR